MAGGRPAKPKLNDVWVDDAGKLTYYNGTDWVPYLSPPEAGSGGDLPPGYLEDAPDEQDGDE